MGKNRRKGNKAATETVLGKSRPGVWDTQKDYGFGDDFFGKKWKKKGKR